MNIERTTFGDIGHMQAARFSFFHWLKARIAQHEGHSSHRRPSGRDPKKLKEYITRKYGVS